MAVAAVRFQKLKTQTGTHLSPSELSFGTQSKEGLPGFEVRLSRTHTNCADGYPTGLDADLVVLFRSLRLRPHKHYRLGTIRSTQIRKVIFAWTLSIVDLNSILVTV